MSLIDDSNKDTNYEKWYYEQIEKLIEGTFSIDDVRNRVLNGERNVYIEKLLIGLLGWNEKTVEESIVLLNLFYDKVDWQYSSPFKPVIGQVGEDF